MTQVTNEQLAGMIATGFEEAALDRARIENKMNEGFNRLDERIDALSDVTLKNIKKRLTRVENDVNKLKYPN